MKKRFCNDYKVPIKIYDEPLFTNRLKLLGKKEQYDRYKEYIESKYGTVQSYIDNYSRVSEEVIEYIKQSEAYQSLNSIDMNIYNLQVKTLEGEVVNKGLIPKHSIYREDNVGKEFISIDMVKANFSALVHYSKSNNLTFYDKYDYEGFMKGFTDDEVILSSKIIRQIIFGKTNSKRQSTYEKYLMELVLQDILNMGVKVDAIKVLLEDEILIEVDKLADNQESMIEEYVNKHNLDNEYPLKYEKYLLGRVYGSGAYIKKIGSKLETKCLSVDEAAMVEKVLQNLPIEEEDLIMMYDNRKVKLLEVPKLELSFTRR